ncbi:MAG: type II toxin-antitoxin system prevent-host-death family antitoxin [Propionibacteriaceae bacterium]|jgi:prevent-host-death family protein|nr:type II toxin-antitoxin system prevent-host-death family antitoxin [Propionibacteriaceae bacterium]
MMTAAVRDLRNNTAEVIQEAREGRTVVLTTRGTPIAKIVPLGSRRKSFLTPTEIVSIPQTDAAMRQDLASLADDTDSLEPIR